MVSLMSLCLHFHATEMLGGPSGAKASAGPSTKALFWVSELPGLALPDVPVHLISS